jgi:hypothetical protein
VPSKQVSAHESIHKHTQPYTTIHNHTQPYTKYTQAAGIPAKSTSNHTQTTRSPPRHSHTSIDNHTHKPHANGSGSHASTISHTQSTEKSRMTALTQSCLAHGILRAALNCAMKKSPPVDRQRKISPQFSCQRTLLRSAQRQSSEAEATVPNISQNYKQEIARYFCSYVSSAPGRAEPG